MQALMLDYQRIRFLRKGAEVKTGACLTHLGEVQSEEQVQLHFWSQNQLPVVGRLVCYRRRKVCLRFSSCLSKRGVAGSLDRLGRLGVIILSPYITFAGSSTISSSTFRSKLLAKLCNLFTWWILYGGMFQLLLGFRANTCWFLVMIRIIRFLLSSLSLYRAEQGALWCR